MKLTTKIKNLQTYKSSTQWYLSTDISF